MQISKIIAEVKNMDPAYYERHRLLGINIAYYRNAKNLSQYQLSDKLNIDASHMSKIERAAVGISLDRLYRIADILEVEPYLLLKPKE